MTSRSLHPLHDTYPRGFASVGRGFNPPLTATRRAHGRGFTLLEVVMASVLGLVVAAACIAIFTALNKTDRSLDRRYHETVELERLHNVMQRTFMSLVVSDQPKPQPPRTNPDGTPVAGSRLTDPNRSTGNQLGADRIPIPGSRQSRLRSESGSSGDAPSANDPTTDPKAENKPENKAENRAGAPKPPPPPRMLLTADPAVADAPMNHRLARMQVAAATQRFELVLSSIPVASNATVRKVAPDPDEDELNKAAPDLTGGSRAVRGRFYLQPNPVTVPGRPTSWTIFWQPLRAPDGVAIADSREVELVPAGQAVPIATDLAYCRWQVFDDRARKVEFQATWQDDLPAYVEMEVETVGGLWASWMFEVDWSRGQESLPLDDEDPNNPDAPNGATSKTKPPAGAASGAVTPRKTSTPQPIGGPS